MTCEIRIDAFEGPLDLLLHLIRKHEMEICDIAISEITAQYLDYIDAMKQLNLDVAGEYLVMAATLLQIKSMALLPVADEEIGDEEELDPRAELVKRLLEYQRYKDAARSFDRLPQLERDLFLHPAEDMPASESVHGGELEPVDLFELVEIFRLLLQRAPKEFVHEVTAEHLSVTERIQSILSTLQQQPQAAFTSLLPVSAPRSEVVVMFLAMLELVKMKLVRIYQNRQHAEIWLSPAVTEDEHVPAGEDSLGYA